MDTEKNYASFYTRLEKNFSTEVADTIIELCGGKDKVMNAVYGSDVKSGFAEDGSLIQATFDIIMTAIQINQLLPEDKRVPQEKIVKTGLVLNISKAVMFEPNENEWERNNRGMLYKFAKLDGALRTGERSLYIVTSAGGKLSVDEFEAIKAKDNGGDDNYARFYSSPLSVILKQASELVELKNRI